MVLEYLPGGTLEDRLANGRRLDDEEAERVAAAIAAGLAHAHDHGLVHRDLKPANILFDAEGRPKIADFGIARLDGGGTLTEAGTVLGTAAYISPEQAAGEPATPASDVYSFGVILFRMLTGRLPFDAVQPLELVALHRDTPPPRVADVRRDAPPAVAALADAALAKDPSRRPRDGRALATALGAPVTLEPAAVTQVLPRAAPAPLPPRRRAPAVATALALLAIGGVAAAYAVTRPDESGTSVDTTTPTRATIPTRTLPTLPSAPATTEASPETTTAATTRETTTQEQTTQPATTVAPPPPSTIAPPPTTEPAPATTTVPPDTTTVSPPTETAVTLTVP
jgi:eukaryotic-like serine/threonine-protein kinase